MKRTWELCDDSDLVAIFNNVWEYVRYKYSLTNKPIFYLNKSKSIRNLGIYTTDNSYPIIVLNKLFLNHKDLAKNTIVHEFAHYVANKTSKRSCNHNFYWKRIAKELGKAFDEKITTYCANNHPVIVEAKILKPEKVRKIKDIIVTCVHCNKEYHYKKEMFWFKGKDKVTLEGGYCPRCKNNEFIIKRKYN